ncbi:MAG: three-Cys-motif partner protein TcmP [Rickettsiales bacterium]|jgi:three-Cys-motif partner protein|nr:three-Cys-motif partner protein TcmP [Rickettsiales bacterium]
MTKNFFAEQSQNSEIKTQIVLGVFQLWLKDTRRGQNLSYIDLFAGPGIYEDGSLSTPLCILQEICSQKSIARKFNVILNDKNMETLAKLRRAITNIRNAKYIKSLLTSNNDANIFAPDNTSSFVFMDPWGWKGMNCGRINNMLQNPNCEIAMLFSFNQFNRFMNFDKFDGLFDDLFDAMALKKIRKFCAANTKSRKEPFVLKEFIKGIVKNRPNCYCLPFRFKMSTAAKTSHYVIFIIRDKARAELAQRVLESFSG